MDKESLEQLLNKITAELDKTSSNVENRLNTRRATNAIANSLCTWIRDELTGVIHLSHSVDGEGKEAFLLGRISKLRDKINASIIENETSLSLLEGQLSGMKASRHWVNDVIAAEVLSQELSSEAHSLGTHHRLREKIEDGTIDAPRRPGSRPESLKNIRNAKNAFFKDGE